MNAIYRFATGIGIVTIQPVQTRAGMGIEHHQRGVAPGEVFQQGDQHCVFEHVSMVAGVEGVAVGKHVLMLTRPGTPSSSDRSGHLA